MNDVFKPIRSISSSEQVASAIRQTIIEGKFLPGENLPSERSLAQRFNVTRNTVREALRRLEQLRLVSIRQGSGITVLDYLSTAGLEFIADLFSSHSTNRGTLMADIAEARTVLGEAMVIHAIDRYRGGSLDQIKEAVEAFVKEAEADTPDIRQLQDLDIEIHSRLMCLAGNRVIMLLHNSIRHIYAQIAQLFEPLMFNPLEISTCYKRMLKALEKDDRAAAKRAMRKYFELGQAILAGSKDEITQ